MRKPSTYKTQPRSLSGKSSPEKENCPYTNVFWYLISWSWQDGGSEKMKTINKFQTDLNLTKGYRRKNPNKIKARISQYKNRKSVSTRQRFSNSAHQVNFMNSVHICMQRY